MADNSDIASRRKFLKLAGLAPAAAAAAMVSTNAEAVSADESGAGGEGYRETDHVRTFYRMARF